MVFSWALALILATALMCAGWRVGQQQIATRFTGVQTVFLGTSLMRHAVPNIPDSLTGTSGRGTFLRVGLSNATELQILTLAQAAVAADARTIYLEINSVVSRFAFQNASCGPRRRLNHGLWTTRTATWALLTGQHVLAEGIRDETAHLSTVDVETALARNYPLHFQPLCDAAAWKALVASAGAAQIVLVTMPRSKLAADRIGPVDIARFDRAAADLAAALHLPLFVPDAAGAWPDEDFVDQAHMSPAGSARFLGALADWQEVNP